MARYIGSILNALDISIKTQHFNKTDSVTMPMFLYTFKIICEVNGVLFGVIMAR